MRRFRAALYIRLSREDGDREESDSVANQRKLLTEYAFRREDLIPEEIYIDDGYTGTDFNRPAFRRMEKDIEQGRIDCVIVKDLSRFGRDYIETGRYLERYFPEKGVRFIAVSDGIDSREQAYDLLLPIKNIFNEQYARDISQKIQATIRTKQKAGEFIGAFPSYGYKKSPEDKNRLIIDPGSASVVKRIFSLYLEGKRKQEIADLLNQEGILCPSAYKAAQGMRYANPRSSGQSRWSVSAVDCILHKEMYAGNMVQGTRHQKMRGKQERIRQDQWIVVEHTHEPVIDKQTWLKVQRLLKKRTRISGPGRQVNAFAGFLICGDCGGPMVRNTWKRRDGSLACVFYCGNYRRYGRKFCSAHSLPEEVLQQALEEELQSLIRAEGDARLLEQELLRSEDKTEMEKARLELGKELRRLQFLQKAAYEDYRSGLLSREEFLSYREDFRKKEESCRLQLQRLEEQETASEKTEVLLEQLQAMKPDREMVAEMIQSVTVYEDRRLRICYNYSAQEKNGSWGKGSGKDRSQSGGRENSESGNRAETAERTGTERDYGGADPGGGPGILPGGRRE